MSGAAAGTPDRPTDPDATQRTVALRERALALGFEAVAVASVAPLEAVRHYEAWLAADRHAGMAWLASAKHRERRVDPARLLRGLRAVLCVAMVHPPERDAARDARIGRIARYAAGEDYHRVMRDRMRELERYARTLAPGSHALWYADTGAILERGWAERAGLGWIGKHAGLLSERLGSWMLLGEVLIDYPLVPDAPALRHVCALPRCVPDACDRRSLPGRCRALHLVPDDRACGRDPARAAAGDRRLDLRLRRVPGGVPVEPLRAARARGTAARARPHRLDARAIPDARRARVPRIVCRQPDPARGA
jgi:hypothetical protein